MNGRLGVARDDDLFPIGRVALCNRSDDVAALGNANWSLQGRLRALDVVDVDARTLGSGRYHEAADARFLTPTLFIYRRIAEGSAPEYAMKKAVACAAQHPLTVARARALGVGITAGSDSGSPGAPHPALFHELHDLVSRGQLTALEAISASTATNARALGLDAEIGTIRPGLQADLLIVDGDPAQDIGQLEHTWGVLQGGRWIRRGTAAALAEEIVIAIRTELDRMEIQDS